MTDSGMRVILLHGGPDEAFDRAVLFARRMAESFGAQLHEVAPDRARAAPPQLRGRDGAADQRLLAEHARVCPQARAVPQRKRGERSPKLCCR